MIKNQRSDLFVYLLSREKTRFITYYDIIKYKRFLGVFQMKILTKLRKLEKTILDLKGTEREEAMKAYRRLLFSLQDEPIYFLRY